MEPGYLVEFFEEKSILVAAVLDLKGDRLQVVTPANRELTLSPKRVLHACPSGRSGALSRQQWLDILQETARRREALHHTIKLEEVWELLVEEGKAVPVAELADLWFNSATPDQVAAMGRALYENRFLFKLKDGSWLPNPPEVVEALKDKALREEEARREMAEAAQWLRTVWDGGEIPDPGMRARLVERLRSVAVFGQESPEYALVKGYLDKAKITGELAPFKLLVRLKVFSEDENLDLYRLEAPLTFSEEARTRALHLKNDTPPDPYAAIRADLTHLDCFTIDGERTRDLDDALSLEIIPEGYLLGVHISRRLGPGGRRQRLGPGGPGPGHLHLSPGNAPAHAPGGPLRGHPVAHRPPGALRLKLPHHPGPGGGSLGLARKTEPYQGAAAAVLQ